MRRRRDDYDTAWKHALERMFREFMRYFFPAAHDRIDWSRGFTFLDKELVKILRGAAVGGRHVDKLVRVFMKAGGQEVLLIHVEVQASEDEDFARRMFVYHYRIYDRHGGKVSSFAILADLDPNWRPGPFEYEALGTELRLAYSSEKLLDRRMEDLEADRSPFAIVVRAHLRALQTRRYPARRLGVRLALVRDLQIRGYNRETIDELLRFVEWVLAVPPELETEYEKAVREIERRSDVEYLSVFERRAMERGEKKGLKKGEKKGEKKGLKKGEKVGLKKGEKKGRREGELAGRRAIVLRLIRKKFGRHAAERAADLLDDLTRPAALEKAGAWVIEFDDERAYLGSLEDLAGHQTRRAQTSR